MIKQNYKKNNKSYEIKLECSTNNCLELERSNNLILKEFCKRLSDDDKLEVIKILNGYSLYLDKKRVIDFYTIEELFVVFNYLKFNV